MKKFEYQTVSIELKGYFGSRAYIDNLNQTLNNMGNQGWELVNAELSDHNFIVCIFKREL